MSPERWLSWADRAYFGTAIIAATFTGLTIAAGIFQNRLNARISDQKDRDLAAFKTDAASKLLAANSEIAGLVAQSDQLKNDNLRLSIRLAELTLPRSIDADAVTTAAKAFPGMKFDLSALPADPETEALATQIEEALLKAGWVEVNWKGGSVTITRPGKPAWGLNNSFGAAMLVDSRRAERVALAVLPALKLTIKDAKVNSTVGAPPEYGTPGAVHFLIGKKPISPK